jgi:hypothetical protein
MATPPDPISWAAARGSIGGLILGTMMGVCTFATAQQASDQPPAEVPSAPQGESLPSGQPTKPPAVEPSEAPVADGEQDMVGLGVFSSNGTRVGRVRAVSTGSGGDIVALLVRTGGFLGFGGRTVAIPQGRFTRTGHSIRLDLDTDQVNGLPEVEE